MPWNWGEKARPIDGQWSPWSAWSTCQISSDPDTLPFRYKERNCSNPAPKNGGAECKGENRRTSNCDDCNIPLGLESGRIQDSSMTALHSHKQFPASAARLNGKSAWCSMNPESLEEPLYLQIELKQFTTISAIASQGFYPGIETLSLRMGRVSKYQLMYSADGFSWRLYKDSKNETTLRGNAKRNGTVLNILMPEVTARFVRVYPLSYFSFICMRLELYGCSFSCGGALGIEPGSIITKSSPTEDQDCLWHVNLPNITKLNMDFINFDIPCTSGYAELRDGDMPYAAATVLARYCGYDRIPPLVMSSSGKLWVRFKSNASDPQVGFYAIYFPGCGGHLQGGSGEITSPNFPNEYFHNSKCIWTITVPEGKSVRLTFVQFNVEGDLNRQRCPHDHLTVWNGSDSLAPLIGKYCNSNPPPPTVCSSGNTMRLKFRSDDALAWTGFFITFSQVDPLMPCAELTSTVVMATSSWPLPTSVPVTPTPSITSKTVFTQQTMFDPTSDYLEGFTTKTATVPLAITAIRAFGPVEVPSSVEPSAVMVNGTVNFMGSSVNGELQAAAQRKQKDDDDDDDGLMTLIILSVFVFIVLCMIIASIIPSAIKRCEKKKQDREMSLLIAASLSIPETNSKDTLEVVPIATDSNAMAVGGSATCEITGAMDEQSLLAVEAAESETVSEDPTAEFITEQSEAKVVALMSDHSPLCGEEKSVEQKIDDLDDLEKGKTDTEAYVAFDVEDDDHDYDDDDDDETPEIGSLRMSYEDLGSSFACEMQTMLSQFVNDDELPALELSILANAADNSLQDNGSALAKRPSVKESETGENIPQGDYPAQDDTKSIQSSEFSACNNTCPDQEGKPESVSDCDDVATEDVWQAQHDAISSHGCRRTASKDRVPGSCTDSKDSGCASSNEQFPLVDNYLIYPANSETSV